MPLNIPTDPNALGVLARLKSLTNVGAQSNRGLNIAAGIDDLGPTDSELEDAQLHDADHQEARTGYSFTDSRENMRDDAMARLRRKLTEGAMAQQADIASKQAGPLATAQGELAKQRAADEAQRPLRESEAAKNNAEAGQATAGASMTQRLLGLGGSGSGSASGPVLAGTPMEPHVDAKGGVSFGPAVGRQISATGTQALQGLNMMQKLGPQILARLEQENPGIAEHPDQFGGVGETLLAKARKVGYNAGLYTPNEDIGQLTQLFKVIGARPYMMGRPNQKIYEDITSHLGDMGFSPGADYARIKQLLALAPELEQGISEVEAPGYVESIRNRATQTDGGDTSPSGLRLR